MQRFDTIAVVDWSARASPSPARPSKDAIWIGEASAGSLTTSYHRTRAGAMAAVAALVEAILRDGQRLLVGFDFPFGYPRGFAEALVGAPSPFALWKMLAGSISDGDDNANNRFEVADAINRRFPGVGPFWGRPDDARHAHLVHLPPRGSERHGHGLPERREAERLIRRTQPCWKLFTTGSVGSQALLGIPRLEALRRRLGGRVAVWPFEAPDRPVVLAEIYPSLLAEPIRRWQHEAPEAVADELQVACTALALWRLQDDALLDAAFETGPGAEEEAWILGLNAAEALRARSAPAQFRRAQ